MQTFLPYSSFLDSAKVLDRKRLGKQRVEVLQLLKALDKGSGSWYNHPCSKMWKGYENALVDYGIQVCKVWKSYGYKDTCEDKIVAFYRPTESKAFRIPSWLGNQEFHASHRSNLLRKDPVHYGQFGWKETSDLPYIWPT